MSPNKKYIEQDNSKHIRFDDYNYSTHDLDMDENYSYNQKVQHHNMKERNSSAYYKRKLAKKNKVFAITLSISIVLFFWTGYITGYIVFNENDSDINNSNTVVEQKQEEKTAPASASVYAKATSDYERVINRSYPIEPDYIAGTGELRVVANSGGKQMEINAAIALEKMVQGLNDAGMDIIVQSTYRTDSDQEYLYNRQIQRQGGNEYKAATISAMPLTSEHQAGLAVDLSIDGTLTEAFASTEQGQWLNLHCAEYGYILRYLPENVEFTGIISEPWHFRYVGSPEIAQSIMTSDKSMEEYYGKYLSSDDLEPYLPYLK